MVRVLGLGLGLGCSAATLTLWAQRIIICGSDNKHYAGASDNYVGGFSLGFCSRSNHFLFGLSLLFLWLFRYESILAGNHNTTL